jgi:pyruvate/2-oxoglutarate dehydrogenase complex dihydrolipoamide acyltransferase (E2) component
MDALSNGPPLSSQQAAADALIRAGHRTHTTSEEAACTRLGFLRLAKGGHASTDADRVFAELAHERFCRPRPTAVSGPLDALRQAFVDRTLEVNLHAASKAAACATFATVKPDKPPCTDAEVREAASERRKATAKVVVAAHARAPPTTKPGDATRPPQKK